MLLNAPDLLNLMMAHINRYCRANVVTKSVFEEKTIEIHRPYLGPPTRHQISQEAIDTQMLPEALYPGSVYISSTDACLFLNQAWGTLHDTKCHTISHMLSSQQAATAEVDSLLNEHGMLLDQSPLYPEEDTKETTFGWNGGRHELSSFSSRIFVLGKEMTEWGKPTIINATLEGFQGKAFGGTPRPSVSRPVRFVSSSEVATYITLAENSRYSAGLLGRKRVWRNSKGEKYDIVEIFYNDDASKSWLPFWGDKEMMLTMNFIKYPKPLTVDDILGQKIVENDEGQKVYEDQTEKEYRVIECEYAPSIAALAADLAMKPGGGQGGEG